MTQASDPPPGRAVLWIAGVLTQLICATCLLLGTIAIVLVQQNKTGGIGLVILWSVVAMAGLVFGGLMGRGGLASVLVSMAIDAGFGLALLLMDYPTLRQILRVLPDSDVATIGGGLFGGAIGMLVVAALCIAAIPQAARYTRWLSEPVPEPDPAWPPASPPTSAFDPHIPSAASTARAFPPPPPSRTRSMMLRPLAEETRSRRRLYMAIGGFAIGVGSGIGVIVSAKEQPGASPPPTAGEIQKPGSATSKAGAPTVGSAATEAHAPAPVRTLVDAERAALARGDYKALAAFAAPAAFAFGVDSDEVVEGRAAIEAQLRHDLGEPPAAGYSVESRFFTAGEDRNHAWIADELEVSAPGGPTRRFAVTQLAAFVEGKWTVVAWHWARQVPAVIAERRAILGTLPAPKAIPNQHDGADDLDKAVRAAFGSRKAFVEARSEHPNAFHFGSGPNEHVLGGSAINHLFGRLKAELRLHDGVRVIAGSAWDPAQTTAPWIGVAALNVDLTAKTRAATNLTQTFRVLAILVREGDSWRIVQTQWSHGGPIL